MKRILILLTVLISFSSQAQEQKGQTCLFTCLHYLHPDKPVDTLIKAWDQFTGSNQDVYQDGARATVKQTVDFIATQVDTMDVRRIGVIQALQDHYRILTVVHLTDDDGNTYDHEIVLTSLKSRDNDTTDPAKVKLLYYNPATGRIQEIKMIDFVQSNPHYIIVVKA